MGIQQGKEHADRIFIENVYDKMLRERGMRREYDIEVDKWCVRKYNNIMENEGKNLVS